MWRVFQGLENSSFVHICHIHVIDFQNYITDPKRTNIYTYIYMYIFKSSLKMLISLLSHF